MGTKIGAVTAHWALAELGLEYTLKVYERHPETMRADPALREVHALGTYHMAHPRRHATHQRHRLAG